jgi:FHA domain-containing protein
MKLTAIRRIDEEAFTPMQAEFRAPGGTIGRGRENRLVLADRAGALCLVQAMVRVSDTSCWLVNLSSMASVSINGDPLECDQEAALRHGDEVAIGAYVLHAEQAGYAAMAGREGGAGAGVGFAGSAGLGAGQGSAAQAHTLDAPAPNVFDDLIGPGTLPVGSAPDVSAHPFDMASAAARNPADPLAQLGRGDTGFTDRRHDPLGMFPNQDERHVDHVFTDATPSTLHGNDPLAQLNDDPIASTLGRQDKAGAASTGRDNVREQAGHMPPPVLRKNS